MDFSFWSEVLREDHKDWGQEEERGITIPWKQPPMTVQGEKRLKRGARQERACHGVVCTLTSNVQTFAFPNG